VLLLFQPGGSGSTYNEAFSDSVTASDAATATVSGGGTYNETISDAVTASDSTTSTASLVATITDSAAAVEALVAALQAAAAASDAAAAGDAVTVGRVTAGTVADAATAGEAVAAALVAPVVVSDPVVASEALADSLAAVAAVTDSAPAADATTGDLVGVDSGETVYLRRIDDQGAKTVSTMGLQPGPVGGDGWSVVAELPTARLEANHHYAFLVTGKIANIRRTGAAPVSGLIQLCLGDGSGTKSPIQLVQIGAGETLAAGEGLPFSFLLVFSSLPAVSDPVWGPTWPNSAPLQLLGRTWWRNDVPAYAVEFDVVDLCWVWADLDAIPATDQMVTVTTTPVSLTTSPSFQNVASGINSAGGAGQTWVHFWSLAYDPGVDVVPQFQVGNSTGLSLAGFAAKHGGGIDPSTGLEYAIGIGHRGTNVAGVRMHHGSFWVQTNAGSVNLPSVRGRDQYTGPSSTVVRRFACISIKLDDLPGVAWNSTQSAPTLTDELSTLFLGLRRWNLELVGQQRSVNPWILATGTPIRTSSTRRSFSSWVDTDGGELPVYSLGAVTTDGFFESLPVVGSGAFGIGPTSPSIQYRARWLEQVLGGNHLDVRDVYVLSFFPTKNPDNLPPGIPSVGPPTAIVPGTEGLSPASLPAPPIAPDVAVGEAINWKREELRGSTGYVRTWGVFVRPRRSFQVTWGPLSASQRDQLVGFLNANQAWKLTPPRESAIAVVPIAELRWSQSSGQTFRVDLEVAELVYTSG
jgi:hypothetical protein